MDVEMECCGLKLGQELEKGAEHLYHEFRRVPPPPREHGSLVGGLGPRLQEVADLSTTQMFLVETVKRDKQLTDHRKTSNVETESPSPSQQ